ncbi:MAG: heme-degrading domain-containing protein [Candidatus Acidiferrales bacterium]
MTIDQDLEKIALQEKRLQFKYFDSAVAWALGTALKTTAEKRGVSVAIDIQLNGQPMFSYSMPGITPDNWDWIRRKRNVVQRYHRSSFAIGLTHLRNQTNLQDKAGLDLKDYAPHGGCFPIILSGTGCVGTITASGLPQRDDHNLVVAVLQDYLQLTGEDLALDSPPAT